jgi:L-malate glycosyltransferase
LTKKILAISNHGSILGGGEHSFLDLFSHLPKSWQVLVTVPAEGQLAARLSERGLRKRVVPLPAVRPWSAHKMAGTFSSYLKVYRGYQPHLIYANGSRAALYSSLTGRILGIPVVWHCRIAVPDIYLDPFISRSSLLIVANSRATASRFRPNVSYKVRVVYNGVDLRWLNRNDVSPLQLVKDDWRVILVVARVSRWKRHDLALHAFERLGQVEPKAHLVCLGARDSLDPGWWDQLQVMTRESLFSERIHWVGQVEDIRPWLRSASLLLLTSDNEPFGRVLVEAMASGVPVIATRSGGVPEIVREGLDGLLAAPGSVHEISECILRLLTDETLRSRISESGRKRAEEFSLEAHVNRMVDVFEEALAYRARRVAR